MMQARALLLATAIAFPAWAGGDASDGHTHGAPAAAAIPVTASTPRAVAATEDFEVVAVLEGRHLLVYVDRFPSNEPVAKAKVEVEGAGLKGLAREAAPGTYVMDLAAALAPAKHALTISIEAGDSADLLSAMLDTSQPVVAAADAHGWTRRSVWIIAALLLLAAGALLVYRRRKAGGI
jgi:cobalt-zinc-cadmium efflux system membrane fusion protein